MIPLFIVSGGDVPGGSRKPLTPPEVAPAFLGPFANPRGLRRGTGPRSTRREVEVVVLSGDYNGWNDVPEEERECVDQYLDTASELSGDPALQSTETENTSWPLPDLSTSTMAKRAGPAVGTSSRA